ncbi:restriction endonuclease subunit S [Aeromonas salmonicida]|nr:restriction endonuclease subunit S [Aeromonas salmonicida]EKP0265231.1 restriction endonuclease subunit S [Aeromonas salmonicida]EKP0269681.1 restriction endonuclease subunit S [Aeromonas salmonicida]EKP0271518.1 restriction endonuclease subunit S [Aeromonas salmonicida]EKP0287274.1 restriction endonuclease subunit S [Aeromonas salmonicida]
MTNYESVRIGDLGKIVTGKTPKTEDPDNFGDDCMFIGPTDLHKHFFISNSERMISTKGLESIQSSVLNGVSILVGCIGWDMGNVGIVNGRCTTNQQINSITNIHEKYNPLYIYYWLKTKKDFLYQQASVTRTPILNKTDFSNIRINLPKEKKYQDRVVCLLAAIDKKIELNNRINAEFEAMAKTLYDYWFVQFDFPDANGKPYKTSGGKIVYNSALKRKIPEGWSDASLVDIATFTNGIACQKYYPNGDEPTYKVIKIREFSSGFDDSSESVHQSVPKKVVVNDGDILFSWSATLEVKLWSGGVGVLNQHIFKVTSDNYPTTFFYFETLKYLEYFKMVAALRKTTMGHITKEHLVASRIAVPPKDIIQNMDIKLSPIIKKMVANHQQNIELEKLRDWLLPMLMNGQVTVA